MIEMLGDWLFNIRGEDVKVIMERLYCFRII